MITSMDQERGKCVVIMPQGVLFHTGREGDMREKLVLSDKVEAVITFVDGLFFGAGVSACAICLNNKKPEDKKSKVLMVDGSNIYTAKRAQKILTEDNVNQLYELYQNYRDEIGFSKVVTIEEIEKNQCLLSVNTYIEKPPVEIKDPNLVKTEFFEALNNVRECEVKLYELLKAGGYIE